MVLETEKAGSENVVGSVTWCLKDQSKFDLPRTADDWLRLHCPYGKPGDRLWVRETWQAQNLDGQWWHEVKREDRSVMNWAWTNPVQRAYLPMPPRWLPAIHMPRMACRITLEVLSVRVERVQDISADDALHEGTTMAHVNGSPIGWVRSYKLLWDSINFSRGYGWDANPWVWVIEFRQVAA